MSMSLTELERALRSLRLSGMTATLEARAMQVAHHEMDFIEAFACLVQDGFTAAARGCSSGASRSPGSPNART